jgi:translation initiation factor 2B subunit (eIF-2B alpha/beta/delta family)
MNSEERLRALVAPLRSDVVSGAAIVAKTAAEVMRRAAIRLQAGTLAELRWGLGEAGRMVLEAQPVMAPLVLLVRNVLAAAEAAEDLEDGRHAAATAAEEFRAELERRARAVAERAAEVLAGRRTVATISSSSTVRAALLMGGEARGRGVVCLESRPMQEGRDLAGDLAEAGVQVTLAVDAAAHSLVPSCDVVVMGCDSIGDRGVVNKIGSAALAQAASRAHVPVYVLADESKILPRGFPQTVDDDRPAEEVWSARPNVRVWNRYFEVVPLDDVTGVVTGSAVLDAAGLERVRAEVEFPEALRRWAEGRT